MAAAGRSLARRSRVTSLADLMCYSYLLEMLSLASIENSAKIFIKIIDFFRKLHLYTFLAAHVVHNQRNVAAEELFQWKY